MLLVRTRLASQCPRIQLLPSRAQNPLTTSARNRHFVTINKSKDHICRLRLLSQNTRPINPSLHSSLPAMNQIRAHAGHSHGHGHSHGSAYITSANRNDAGVRITRIGLFVNLGMAITKGIGGYLFHSQALVADAFHALTDLVSDFMTLATISWSLRPPTERFPTGYGKVESLGALGVSGLLVFGGIGMGLNGLDALYLQFWVDHSQSDHVHGLFGGFGHSHSHSHQLPNLNAAWLAAGSIVVKEWLYRASKSRHYYLSEYMLTRYSDEGCKRAQVLRACVECCSSPSRLPHKHSRFGHHCRFPCNFKCFLA